MKKLVIVLSAVALTLTACGQNKKQTLDAEGNPIVEEVAVNDDVKQEKRKTGARVRSEADSISYAIGVDLGTHLKDRVKNSLDADFNLDKIFAAIKDVLRERPTLTSEEAYKVMEEYFSVKIPARNKAAGEAFLEKVQKDNPNIQRTESGLLYEIIEAGSDVKATDVKDKVKVQYAGTLKDGTEFDSSSKRGPDPAEFVVGNVIKGWQEGMMLVGEGGKIKLWIPSDLGYGERGMPYAGIGANEPLMFEVELIQVIPAEQPAESN